MPAAAVVLVAILLGAVEVTDSLVLHEVVIADAGRAVRKVTR